MKHEMKEGLALKWLVGTLGSTVAALFSTSVDESLREIAIIMGIVVSLLTIANLAWTLTHKIIKGSEEEREAIKDLAREFRAEFAEPIFKPDKPTGTPLNE